MQTSADLKSQCLIQEAECEMLDSEQKRVNSEMNELRLKVETLEQERVVVETKMTDLKNENDQLEAFLGAVAE